MAIRKFNKARDPISAASLQVFPSRRAPLCKGGFWNTGPAQFGDAVSILDIK